MDADWTLVGFEVTWALLGAVGLGIVVLVRFLHKNALTVQSLEQFKDDYPKQNEDAHARLEEDGRELLSEVKKGRDVSERQHQELADRMNSGFDEVREEFRRTHSRIDDLTKDVSSIKGWVDAKSNP